MLSCLTEFNEEAYRKDFHDEGYNEGYGAGYGAGFQNAVVKFIHTLHTNNTPKDEAITQLTQYFDLSEEKATTIVNEYWDKGL